MTIQFLLFLFLLQQTASKYMVISDITADSVSCQWTDIILNQQLQLCKNYQSESYVGQQSSTGQIYWKRIYSLPKTNRIYVYFEYQISGSWNNDEIQIFSNNIKVYSEKIVFADSNKQCTEKFFYESQIYFTLNIVLDTLTLEFKVLNTNLGLYIKNIVITQQQQRGRNEMLPYQDSIVQCSFTGSEYSQYYCKCGTSLVYQNSECKPSCDQNFLYSSSDNTCYQKSHCSTCLGLVENLVCDVGYYFYTDPIYGDTYCLNKCPLSHYQDETLKVCSMMKDYLSTNENGEYPVLHTYFFLNIHNFLHHFESNEFYFSIKSIPEKTNERGFFYRDGAFHIGSWDTFQSQTLIISQNLQSSQHKLRFRAKAYFIDFNPAKCNFYINGVLQNPVTLQVNPNNQKDSSKLDYYAYYDFYWVRSELYPVVMNTFMFEIEQPLQSGDYVGYFYIDELNVFQFECQTGCNTCFTYQYCNPCLNPAHKNLQDCSCLSDYTIKNDICISCPIYCTTCDTADVCVACKATTLRINSPACDTCPSNYYVKANTENCQPCITGCKVCSNDTSCTQCQSGYFRNSSNVCVTLCPDGQFNDSSNINDPKCSICNINCLTCQNLATTCTGCKGLATLVSDHCYLCNDGQYLSGTTCVSCIQNCQTCLNVTCNLCQESFFYKSQTNECLPICDDRYFGNTTTKTCDACNSACLTCVGGTNQDCLSCPAGKFLNIMNVVSGECNLNCFLGYYKQNDQCVKCWKGCYSCFDGTSECMVCATKYYRFKTDNKCYEKCPDGYYNNPQGNQCSSCDIKCKTCDGFSEKNCLSCNSPLVYYQKQCLTDCPESYGNSNNVCVQCAPNCLSCFGTLINQCLSCSIGFYYLNNQCYSKCPTFFVGIRPQYVCKCIYENCVSCTATQYFLNNVCYGTCPQGYYGFNGLCIKCDITCGQCFGEGINECLNCSTGLILFENKCIPDCLGNLYHDIATNECKYCDLSCLACTGPNDNNCTACPDGKLFSQNGKCQDNCSDGEYPVISEKKCYACDSSCVTCFGSSYKNCLTCPSGQFVYLFECVASCPDGFVTSSNGINCDPNTAIVIAQCAYQCETCELTARFCKKCAGNRSSNAPNCDCESGYFDDGVSSSCPACANKCQTCTGVATHCLKCKGDRLLPNCECPTYYYDDGESVNCTKCQDNCETCDSNGCITCLADRLNPPNCECPEGYYEAFQYFCQQCSQKCITCAGTALLCLTCSGQREEPPICGCPSGYFENSEIECQQCNPTCKDCNINGCLSCYGNRIGPEKGQCLCDTNGISRFNIGQIYCTDCQYGVPYFGLNEDFTGFYFEFGGQVIIPDSITDDLCTAFFEPSTLAKLGTNPLCDRDFSVIFGENPTIKVDDLLQLQKIFTLVGCNSAFTKILPLPLKIPPTIDIQTHLPNIKFKEIPQQNVCEELSIEFDKLYFNGGQKFEIIEWFQALPITQKPQIQSILQDATLAQSDQILFPSQTFDSGVYYKISVKILSFANLQNTASYQFQGILKSTLKFQSNSENNQFHRFENITIPLEISYYNCYLINEVEQTLSYEIILKNTNQQIFSESKTQRIANGFKYDVPINFEPYYFKFKNPYSLILNAKITKTDETTKIQNLFDIFIVPSSPILKIEGGNRMVGYTEDLNLNSIITDPDLTKEEASNITYTCYWSCQDIVNGTTCLTQNNQTLNFNNNCNQTIPGKSFAPYKVLNFEFSIIKTEILYSTKVSIQFIELDLPALTVIGPDQNQLHNYYDEFIYQAIYPGINPDVLMYAGAIIYDQVTQATFQFYYLEFKFKIQNYFTNFDLKKGNTARMRLSVYDPRFIMPSINTVILQMNIPPQNCKLSFSTNENFVEFLDTLNISVKECADDNIPLLYSVLLFPNSSIYQSDLEHSNFYNYQLLVPPQQNFNFFLTLPFYNKQDMLLVFKIKDSQEGIVNITKSISVKQYLNITEQEFRNYQNSLEQNFDQILIGYDLITQRLKQISNLNDYKIELLQELIDMDQNQTILSNQTETLYRCISNILSQNVSLIQYNETLILSQLNYRIELSKEKLIYYTNLQRNNQLTSLQNVDKSNYVKQYYTFSQILSSYINYRVEKNVTATEIQNQLSQMINYLQDISVANEPMFKIQSNSVDMNFGFLTSKMVNDIAGSSIKDDSQQALRLLESQSESVSEKQNQTTDFYKFSQSRFLDNPFYATKGFPKNSSGYQAIDPKMINLNSSSTSMNLSSPMKFKFPVNKTMANNTIPKCVTQVSDEDWNADVCSTKNKDGEAICECESLNPTSIMESLDFIADKAAQVFSLDTFLAFGSFPFYKTYVFYFYLVITGVYIYIVYWGVRVDNQMFTKVYAEQELLEQQKKLEEQKLKELEEQVEKQDSKENIQGNDEKNNLKIQKIDDQLDQNVNSQQLPILLKPSIFSNNKSYDKIILQNRLSAIQTPEEKIQLGQGSLNEYNIEVFQQQLLQKDETSKDTKTNVNFDQMKSDKHITTKQDIVHKEQSIEKKSCESLEEQLQEKDKEPDQNKIQRQQSIKPKGLKDLILKNTVSRIKAYIEYLKFFHQILSIVYKSDQKKPRGLRASIVYTSILGSLAVLFVFNQPNNLSFTVALALLTAPANKIYQIILEKMLSHKKKTVRSAGAVFMICSAGLISYVMLAGLVMMDSVDTANQWSYIFIGTFTIDNIFYTPIQLIFQYLVHMEFIRMPFFQKLLDKILDEKAKEFLYGLIDDLGGDE